MTGNDLADMVEACLQANPDLARYRTIRMLVSRGSLTELRAVKEAKPATVARILAFIANPDPKAKRVPEEVRLARLREVQAKSTAARLANHDRNIARIRRDVTKVAQDLLDAGKTPADVKRAAVRHKMIELQKAAQESSWAEPQIMVAISKLQRRFRPVCSAKVVGGPEGQFIVGRRRVDRDELLAMARAA